MQISNDPNVWIIYALVFLLGLLVGAVPDRRRAQEVEDPLL